MVRWKPLLLFERLAQAPRTHYPTPIQLWFAVKRPFHAELRREAESKKAPT